MRAVPTLAAVLGLVLAAPAMAQSTGAAGLSTGSPSTGSSSTGSSSTGSSSTGSAATTTPAQPGAMAEAVKNDLAQAGFTDIQVMPSSFLVRAKDKAGRPVMMVINPDSVTEVTNVGNPGADTAKK